ncbi:MAG: hypothetical protein NTV22_10035 [bacterium]|nr:hypothetical protein [bacterium]
MKASYTKFPVHLRRLLVGLVAGAALLPACSKPAPPVPPPKPAQQHVPARHTSPPTHRVAAATTNAGGAWLVGTFIDTRRAPVTNVTACWRSNDTETTLPLGIEADGAYVTAPMPTGTCTVSFAAPQYHPVVCTVPLATPGPVIREVLFEPILVVTCTVLDAVSQLPIADVEVDIMGHNENTSPPLLRTDMQGIVLIECQPSPTRAEFRHPRYAPSRTIIWVNELNKVILLSGAGALVARVLDQAGTPETNVYVALECFGDRFPTQKVQADGIALFTNLPAHSSPFAARVRDACWLATATNLCVTAGTVTYADITLPACGSLLVRCPTGAVVNQLSGSIREETLNSWSERGAFSQGDFGQRDDGWFLGRVQARSYRVTVYLRGSPEFTTNITILPDQLTTLDVVPTSNAQMNSGVITGFVHDLYGTGQVCMAIALTGSVAAIVESDYSPDGHFAIEKLDSNLVYNVRIIAVGFTNMVVNNVTANGAPLDIVLPNGFRVTGVVVDDHGAMLQATVRLTPVTPADQTGMDSLQSALRNEITTLGEFAIQPVGPGDYTIDVRTRGYASATRPITVTDRDLDVGEIVLGRGLTVWGRIIDTAGNAVANANFMIYSITTPGGNSAISDFDGRFRITGVLPNTLLYVLVSAKRDSNSTQLDGLTTDTDLGDITIGSGTYIVLTVRTHDGRPAQGIYLGNTASDAHGKVEGALVGRTDFVTLLKKPMRELRQMPASSDFFRVRFQPGREMTNYVTATLPADFTW